MTKDNFSTQSEQYALYRPVYPRAVYDYLDTVLSKKGRAWDCGTGNGQVAVELAKRFKQVFATDISRNQLHRAPRVKNISYSVQPAEKTDFPDNYFDLIVAAQAIHWFDFERFYNEVRRTARKEALLVVLGYNLFRVNPEVDRIVREFNREVLAPFWDFERRYVDENYQSIPFPFEEIAAPEFYNDLHWSFQHLLSYLETWSAVKHYIRLEEKNPLDLIREKLLHAWGDQQEQKVRFPILLRIGKVHPGEK